MPAERRKDGPRRREPREPDDEPREAVELHDAYLQHRLAGGEQPNPRLYLRALDQFRRLPGAIRGRPGVTPPPEPDADQGDSGDDHG